jgi:hypothetical protein
MLFPAFGGCTSAYAGQITIACIPKVIMPELFQTRNPASHQIDYPLKLIKLIGRCGIVPLDRFSRS